MKPKALSIDLLRIDGDTQSRVAINEDVVDDYAEIICESSGEWPFPPLDVFHDGSEYYVADGFHRFLAANRAGRASLQCNVRRGTARDARIFGMTANDRHGLRMSRADKRACVEWLLDSGGKLSHSEIARCAGVTARTVRAIVADRKESKPNTHTDAQRKISGEQTNTDTDAQRKISAVEVSSGGNEPSWDEAATPTATESIVLDAIDRPVPERFRQAHADQSAIQTEARKLDSILRNLKGFAEKDGGKHLEVSALETSVKELKGRIFDACYWSECPKCEGGQSACAFCHSAGWIPKSKSGKLSAKDKEWLGCS